MAKTPEQTVAPFTQLLSAHAALIRDTSETMAQALSDVMLRMHNDINKLDHDSEQVATLRADLDALTQCLQVQDILRQQVMVIETGLETVASAPVPDPDAAEDWHQAALNQLRAAYVMQSQHNVHASFFDLPEEEEDHSDDLDEMFF